jgi:hypothetical protein
MDTSHPLSTPMFEDLPFTRTVTIDDAIPFHVLIRRDTEASLMSLQDFLTLQIPNSDFTLTPPV